MFNGFTKTGIQFLKDLAANNNKEWFELNRHIYDQNLLTPLRQLVSDLQLPLKSLDAEIETSPAINKTISKIYRDTRFSANKSPFRTEQWISFKRPMKIWGNVPEFYFYFTPEKYGYGMGFYSATPQNMEKIRSYILTHPEKFEPIIATYHTQNQFILGGENYKRAVANSLPEEFQKWFQKKSLYVGCEKNIDNFFFSVNLKDKLEKAFAENARLYHFWLEAIF